MSVSVRVLLILAGVAAVPPGGCEDSETSPPAEQPTAESSGGISSGPPAGGTSDGSPETAIPSEGGASESGPPGATQGLGGASALPGAGGATDSSFGGSGNAGGAGGVNTDPQCNMHWDWTNPQPHGKRVEAVWGLAQNDVWAVGEEGLVMHFDGLSWTTEDRPTQSALLALWGLNRDDVWAVGNEGVFHFDGSSWALRLAKPGLVTVWASGPDDVWAAGPFGAAHWNGNDWEEDTPTTSLAATNSLWGSARTDLWFAGDGIRHWDGSSWISVLSPAKLEETGCSVIEWADQPTASRPDPAVYWGSIRGRSSSDVWATTGIKPNGAACVVHFDGQNWSEVTKSTGGLRTLFGVPGTDDVWALREDWTLARWNGVTWTAVSTPTTPDLLAFSGSSEDDIWGVGPGFSTQHWDGEHWTEFTPASAATRQTLLSVDGSAPNDVWAVGTQGAVVHFDGNRWQPQPSATEATLRGIRVCAPNDLWAVGDGGTTLHSQGEDWSLLPGRTNADLFSLACGPAGSAWAVGDFGALLYFDGSTWMLKESPTDRPLQAVWGTSEMDLWVADEQLDGAQYKEDVKAWHFDGSLWSEFDLTAHLDRSTERSVCLSKEAADGTQTGATGMVQLWGAGSSDLWLATRCSGLAHWDGQNWTYSDWHAPMGRNVLGLSGTGANDIWAVGSGANLAHFNGTDWTTCSQDGSSDFRAVWNAGGGNAFVVGATGVILRGTQL